MFIVQTSKQTLHYRWRLFTWYMFQIGRDQTASLGGGSEVSDDVQSSGADLNVSVGPQGYQPPQAQTPGIRLVVSRPVLIEQTEEHLVFRAMTANVAGDVGQNQAGEAHAGPPHEGINFGGGRGGVVKSRLESVDDVYDSRDGAGDECSRRRR